MRKEIDMNTQICTNKGVVQGVQEDGYVLFKGIPYAKPPIGDLRWKRPEETESWDGVYMADTWPPMCMQILPSPDNPMMGPYHAEFYSNPEFMPPMSEDCLYLNIWMPDYKEGEKLPVAFWIHGGGFGGGFSSEVEFDGEAYAKRGVMLVSVAYRTNIFGFFAHPWLDKENEEGISGNYGIYDQLMALNWVYENIEAFGGDKNNITIFGQSAGAMSTQIMVSSELTGNIPAKAILQSGITCDCKFLYTPTLKEEEEIGEMFVRISGADSIEELRKLPAEEILKLKEELDPKLWQLGKGLVLVPNVDGVVLKETVGEAYRNGHMKKIPYICGVVTDDLAATPEEIKKKKTGILMEDCKHWALKTEELGQNTYVYHFNHDVPGEGGPAFHSSEIWYTFGTIGRNILPMTEEDYALSDKMVDMWTNFMKYGCPDPDGSYEWKAYQKAEPYINVFE